MSSTEAADSSAAAPAVPETAAGIGSGTVNGVSSEPAAVAEAPSTAENGKHTPVAESEAKASVDAAEKDEKSGKSSKDKRERSRSRSPRRSSRDRDRKPRDDRRSDRDKRDKDDDKDRRRPKRSKSRSRERSRRDRDADDADDAKRDDRDRKNDKSSRKASHRSRSRSKDRRRSPSRDRRRRSSSRDRRDRRRRDRSDSRDRRRRDRSDSRDRRRRRSPSREKRRRRSSSRSKSPPRPRHELPIPGPLPGMDGALRVSDIINEVLYKKAVGVPMPAATLAPPLSMAAPAPMGLPGLTGIPASTAAAIAAGLPGVATVAAPAIAAVSAAAATKPARELYIGGIPPGISALQLQQICGQLLVQLGGATAPGNPVVGGWIASDGVFGFVEFRTVEECNNALTLLNGQPCLSGVMRVGRPKSFNGVAPMMPGAPAMLPGFGMGALGMGALPAVTGLSTIPGMLPGIGAINPVAPAAPAPAPGADKIVVSNIPPHLRSKATLVEILSSLGEIKECTMLIDPETHAARDVAVLEYGSRASAEIALKAIPSISIGASPLVCEWFADSVIVDAPPTKFVELGNIAAEDEIGTPEEIEELKADVKDECEKFGKVVNIVLPPLGHAKAGLLFLEYETTRAAVQCVKGLRGRKFAERVVTARFVKDADVPQL